MSCDCSWTSALSDLLSYSPSTPVHRNVNLEHVRPGDLRTQLFLYSVRHFNSNHRLDSGESERRGRILACMSLVSL
jgi:hypothetical protein